jgi:hypothetical protein
MTNKLLCAVYDCRALGLTTCYMVSALMLHESWHLLLKIKIKEEETNIMFNIIPITKDVILGDL